MIAGVLAIMIFSMDEAMNILSKPVHYLLDPYNYLNLVGYLVTVFLAFFSDQHGAPRERTLAALGILCLCMGLLDLMTYVRYFAVFVCMVGSNVLFYEHDQRFVFVHGR